MIRAGLAPYSVNDKVSVLFHFGGDLERAIKLRQRRVGHKFAAVFFPMNTYQAPDGLDPVVRAKFVG